MRPIIIDIGQITQLYLGLLVAVVFALIFFSWGMSYGQAKKWASFKALGLGVIFAVVGGVIIYFAYSALGLPKEWTPANPFPIKIYAYGLMLVIAFIVGTIVAIRRGKTEGISADTILDLIIFIIIGAIIGARILFVILKFKDYSGNLINIINIPQGGLSEHGGVIGGMLAGWLYTSMKKIPFWKLADVMAPSMALGMAIGRLGCFLNGCCYGITCSATAWYGVTFPPNPHIPELTQEPRHAAQLYMLALNLLVFFILTAMYKKKKFDGHIFFLWVGLYSIARFFQEFYRFNVSSDVIFGFITIAQLASVILAILAFVIIAEMKKRKEMSLRAAESKKKAAAEEPKE